MAGIVKDIGHRQMYDILQSRKPRAARGELWGFRVEPGSAARVPAVETRIGGQDHGPEERCPGRILPVIAA